MQTIKLTLEYEGTLYAGWQRQPKHPTIQAALEEALFKITQQHIPAVGAGRTDSGVHAVGQVVSFQSEKDLDEANGPRPSIVLCLKIYLSFPAKESQMISMLALAPRGKFMSIE